MSTCYWRPGYVPVRGLAEDFLEALAGDVHKDVAEDIHKDLAEDVHKDVDEAIDEVVAGGGGSHPEETCGGLLGPAHTDS